MPERKTKKPSDNFKTPAMKRIALEKPLTPTEEKLFGSASNREEYYKNKLGSIIFPRIISDIKNEEALKAAKDFASKKK